MKFGLKEETVAKINSVFKKHPEVEEVIIYGSRAKENYRDGSDIDLSIKGGLMTNSVLSKINCEIDELNTPYLFDISILDQLNSSDLKEHIHRVGKVFYKKQEIEMISNKN
ncbi:MAG TPA: nucleotidyltransferase domain-containing protein [Salinimicrobium sp.]|nr:nucleotidyltransferase domain-containing protein [Salinimicrobium sp.]